MSDRTQGLTYIAAFKGIERLLEAKSNIVIDLVGHGGIGKTQLVQELAQKKNYGFYEITCSLLQPGDLSMPVPKEDRIAYYLNPQIQAAVDEANAHPDRLVLLFLDEFNRPIAMVQGELMNLVLQRQLMGIHLPENVVVITAENPSSDTEGFEGTAYSTNARDMAINDRTMRIRMGTNLDNWLEAFARVPLANGRSRIHPLVIDFLEAEGRQYFIVTDETRDKNPTPRAYERLSHFFDDLESTGLSLTQMEDQDLLAFLIEGIEGCIGQEAGQIFLTFLQSQTGDYIKAKEIVELSGDQLPQEMLERFNAMQSVRKKRILEDLTAYLTDHTDLLEDTHLIKRYVHLLLSADPDLIYSLVNRLVSSKEGDALYTLNQALSQEESFIDKAYEITMATTGNDSCD
ncbi:ATP-binding protein [Aerococcus christensenii]|uniref:ATP-binding protein n=1 Tax=Aerococcus christensenii TaxID=87541 RepID=A0A2I1K746_9LACT|nr:ATP-binding protein [Aerococcus christensenii]PKY91422.1 ATP-binding protein [Aerococcus christensenii]